ncbi:hypothetical protein [Halarchaeum grantii]|nr:hypothetical protein [Halarchaeum grantii]
MSPNPGACGEPYAKQRDRATTDRWHCARPDCGERGLGDDLKRIER